MQAVIVCLRLTAPDTFAPIGTTADQSADASGPDADQLRSLEQAWLRASSAHDTAALDRLLARDFVHVDYRGRVHSKADALRVPVAPATDRQTLSQIVVREYGDTGIVTGLNTVTTADGTLEIRLRFTDVFVRTGGRWQVVLAQETPCP